jgi:hypothetical protein
MNRSLIFFGVTFLVQSLFGEFNGQIGFAYQFQDEDYKSSPSNFFDKENNAFSTAITLSAKESLIDNLSFGVEVAGWSDFGLDIADDSRVESPSQTSSEISQGYLEYKLCNSSLSLGRVILSKKFSPWLWSDRSVGVVDWSYDGVVLKSRVSDKREFFAFWTPHIYHNSFEQKRVSDSSGIFMVGLKDNSLDRTIITLNGYYIPKNKLIWNKRASVTPKDCWSFWGSLEKSFQNETLFGVQGAFSDGDIDNWRATYAIATKVSSKFQNLKAEFIGGYINGGDFSLSGAGGGNGIEDSGFWGDTADISADSYGAKEYFLQTRFDYKLQIGSLYGILGYWDFKRHRSWGDEKSAKNLRVGYKFDIFGLDSKVEYRYREFSYYHSDSKTRERIRIEAYYRF